MGTLDENSGKAEGGEQDTFYSLHVNTTFRDGLAAPLRSHVLRVRDGKVMYEQANTADGRRESLL